MNDSAQRDKLDALLHDWLRRHQPSQDQQPLQQRIVDAWRQECEGVQQPTLENQMTPPRHALRHGLIWFALGAAAAALVAVLIYPRLHQETVANVTPGPPAGAWIGPGQQIEKLQLFREMEQLFENRLAWIAETAEGVQLEVRDVGLVDDPTAARLAVRVVVARRNGDAPEWTPVWTLDMVVREEQTVCFSPTSQAGHGTNELYLWAYRLDEDIIAVDSDLSLELLAHHSEHSGAQESGVPIPVTSFQYEGSEYRVFQTVAILDREA